MNLKVIIPLKTNSLRVKNKNLRPFFDDESLFDIKAKQLIKIFNPDDVLVSSEDKKVETLVKKYGFNFHLRDINLTSQNVNENELVENLVNALDDKFCDVMWVQVTQPLFSEFSNLIEVWEKVHKSYDSLAVVKKIKHHLLSSKGQGINFNFGYWHKTSQELDDIYEITWSAFIMSRELLKHAYYQIGAKPYLYETQAPLVDINTEQDFKMAQIIYKHLF